MDTIEKSAVQDFEVSTMPGLRVMPAVNSAETGRYLLNGVISEEVKDFYPGRGSLDSAVDDVAEGCLLRIRHGWNELDQAEREPQEKSFLMRKLAGWALSKSGLGSPSEYLELSGSLRRNDPKELEEKAKHNRFLSRMDLAVYAVAQTAGLVELQRDNPSIPHSMTFFAVSFFSFMFYQKHGGTADLCQDKRHTFNARMISKSIRACKKLDSV